MIYKPDDNSYLDEVIALIQEYITELHRDLTFQNLQQELNDLSSQYLPPYGHLMVAVEDGYKEMVLDTIQPLQSAIHLYHQFGFYEIPAYYNNPMDDVVYMKKEF